jgi:hypothetical protein
MTLNISVVSLCDFDNRDMKRTGSAASCSCEIFIPLSLFIGNFLVE